MYALVDCNSFYASCEKIFRPDLRNRPVVVLSNNDGCVIAATPDAKALGLVMGVPYFQARAACRRHDIAVFSSNYALYGDISRRVMQILSSFARRFEIYSIDEAFLDVGVMAPDTAARFGDEVAGVVMKWVGMPVCVGLAATKTLAKVANRTAKSRGRRSCTLDNSAEIDAVLADLPVTGIWGVASRWGRRLNRMGIVTALDLKRMETAGARRHFGIVLERTVRELRGEPCIELEETPPAKKQVHVSRSFCKLVTAYDEMEQAVATYAARVGEKLRRQDSFANAVSVWVATNPFREGDRQYSSSATVPLTPATSDTGALIAAAKRALGQIYHKGYLYKKAGVMAVDLVTSRDELAQGNLFYDRADRDRSLRMMKALDEANRRYGAGTIFMAAQGIDTGWNMRRDLMSPYYTTRWSDLPKVN